MGSKVTARLLFGAVAIALLSAQSPPPLPVPETLGGLIRWTTPPAPFAIGSTCDTVSYRLVQIDGGAWDGGQVTVDVLTDTTGFEVRDTTCTFPSGQFSAGASGQGSFGVTRLAADAGALFGRVSIAAADFISPYPFPVQWGTSAPSQLQPSQTVWSSPANVCGTGVVTYVDAQQNPWMPAGSEFNRRVAIRVSPDDSNLKLYSDEFCTSELSPNTFNGQREWLIAPFGAHAYFSYRGAVAASYSGTTATSLFGSGIGVGFQIGSSSGPSYAKFSSTTAQTVAAGECSPQSVSFGLYTLAGAPATSDGTFRVTISKPTHLRAYSDAACTQLLPADTNGAQYLQISSGSSGGFYFFKSTIAGAHQTSLSPGNAPFSVRTDNIVAGPLAALAIPTALPTVEPGVALPAVVVNGTDFYGNPAQHNATVTLSLVSATPGNVLSGTTVRGYDNTAKGVTFDGLSVALPEDNVKLRAMTTLLDGGQTAGFSAPFNVRAPAAPELVATVAPLSNISCNATLLQLSNRRDGGEVSHTEEVEVCADPASLATVGASSLTGGDGGVGGRCVKGFFSRTADIKFKSTVPTTAEITVFSPRGTVKLPQVSWTAGPPVPRRSALTLELKDLSPGESTQVQFTARDQCSGAADMTGQTVHFQGGAALELGAPVTTGNVTSASVKLTSCEGVPAEGVGIQALLNGVPVEDGAGGVQQVFVRGKCTLERPIASVILSPDKRSTPYRSAVVLTADVARLDSSKGSVKLRLSGGGLSFVAPDGALSESLDREVELSDSPPRLFIEAIATGNQGTVATVTATPVDALSRVAGDTARAEVEISALPVADLGCSATGASAGLLLAVVALLRRRVRPVG